MENKPSLLAMESDIQHYDYIEIMVDEIEPLIILESIELSTGKVARQALYLDIYNNFLREVFIFW